jgi:hypothetical protein
MCPVCGLKAPAGFGDPAQDCDDSRDRTVGELERVHSTLKQIHSTLTSRPLSDVWGLFWFIIIIFLLESWPGSTLDRRTDKAWYSVRYGAEFANIAVEKRPVDCDFMHAPLGGKGCEYKKRITAQQGATNSVIVYWEKKEPPLRNLWVSQESSVQRNRGWGLDLL